MLSLVRFNLETLEHMRLHFSLPMFYYNCGPMIPLTGMPEHQDAVRISEVLYNQTIESTFDELGLEVQENQPLPCIWADMLKIEDNQTKELKHYYRGERWGERVIIPSETPWKEASDFGGSHAPAAQTDFRPVGIAPKETIEEILSRYKR